MTYVPFDLIKSYRREEPLQFELTVCKPDYNRTMLQQITTAYGRQLTRQFSAPDEVKFRVPQTIDGTTINEEYKLIDGDFIIYMEFDGVGQYFVIDACPSVIGQNNIYKDVTAYSLEYTFGKKVVRGWEEGQQPLTYMLDYIISRFPSWSIGIVESELAIKERTMSVSEQSMLDFMNDIQKSYLCVFVYDTVNRVIDVRSLENIGSNKGLILSERNYADQITIKPNFQETVTRLRCYGYEDMTINSKTATGENYIENFDYYMAGFEREDDGNGGWNVTAHSKYMSDSLCMALLDYRELVDNNEYSLSTKYSELSVLQNGLNVLLYSADPEDLGLTSLESDMLALELQLNALIKLGTSDLSAIKSQITAKQAEIDAKQADVDSQTVLVNSKLAEIEALVDTMSIENNLSTENIKELDMFIREKTWSDTTYVDETELYEEGVRLLTQMAQPAIDFSVNVMNFLNSLDHSENWDTITTGLGDLITIDAESIGMTFEARLVTYTYTEDGNYLTLGFSNKGDLDNPSVYLKDLLKDAVSVSTTVKMNAVKYGKYTEDRTTLMDYMNGKLDLAKQTALAGINNEVTIDERGILLTRSDDMNKQLKMIGDLIVFTNDGWNSAGTAISSEGVVAESIYGKILAGANLTIENSSGSFKVDANGVTIDGASLRIVDSEGVSTGITESMLDAQLNTKVNAVMEDQYLTRTESEVLSYKLSEILQEQVELNAQAVSACVNGSAQSTAYANAITDLTAYLNTYWVNQSAYPIDIEAVSGMERATLQTKLSTVQGTKVNLQNKISQQIANSEMQTLSDSINTELVNIYAQLDGTIETWFMTGAPTLSNEPAVNWTDDAIRATHEGDMYYDKDSGYSYRFFNQGTAETPDFEWSQISSNDATQALALAQDALDTADGKRRIFVAEPTTPYDAGDMWVQGVDGDMYVCNTSRATGSFLAGDWELATKYTDDTRAILAESNAKTYADTVASNAQSNAQSYADAVGATAETNAQSYADGVGATAESNATTYTDGVATTLQSAIDNKVETWFYGYTPSTSNAPAVNWTTTALKDNHVGDLFYNTANGKVYRYKSDYTWESIQDTDIQTALTNASTAQDTADGKRTVFTATPVPPYQVGDLWVQGNGGDILFCSTERTSGSYVAGDFVTASKYTDDTRAIEAEANAIEYTDLNTGNLVQNVSRWDSVDRWTNDATVATKPFFGQDIPVMALTSNANAYTLSDKFNIDPSKAYEISMWMLSSGATGKNYMCILAYDAEGNQLTVDEVNTDGTFKQTTNIPHIWTGTGAIDDGSGTNWVKRTGYIMPAGSSDKEAQGLGSNVDVAIRIPANTASLRVRILNFDNGGVTETLWVANPKAIEMSVDILANAIKEDAVYNGVTINTTDGVKVEDGGSSFRAYMNATNGFLLEHYNGSTWDTRFEANQDGDLIANNITLTGGLISSSDGLTTLNLNNGQLTINADRLVVNGGITADDVSSDWVYAGTIQASQLIMDGSITFNDIGGTISFGDIDGSLSYNDLTDKPNVGDDNPSYIHSTYISSTDVIAPNITGGVVTGATLQTATSGKRIVIDSGNDISIYSSTGALAGAIDYDTNGAGTSDEAQNRIYFRTANGYAMKIESQANMSIEAVGGKVYMMGDVSFMGGTVTGLDSTIASVVADYLNSGSVTVETVAVFG